MKLKQYFLLYMSFFSESSHLEHCEIFGCHTSYSILKHQVYFVWTSAGFKIWIWILFNWKDGIWRHKCNTYSLLLPTHLRGTLIKIYTICLFLHFWTVLTIQKNNIYLGSWSFNNICVICITYNFEDSYLNVFKTTQNNIWHIKQPNSVNVAIFTLIR